MPKMNLDRYAPEPLTLTIADRDWVIPPPNAHDGLVLAAIAAVQTTGGLAAGLTPEERAEALAALPQSIIATLETASDQSLADLALSPEVHQGMIDAGYPALMIDRAALAAQVFWVTGSMRAAIAMLDAAVQDQTVGDTPAPKADTSD